MMTPYLIAFAAISCYASLGVISKKMLPEIPAFSFIAITMVMLSLLAVLGALLTKEKFTFVNNIDYKSWIWVIGFSIINCVGFALNLKAIQLMPIAHYQVIALISPIIGGLLAFLILNEHLNPKFFIGFAITAIGIYITLKK